MTGPLSPSTIKRLEARSSEDVPGETSNWSIVAKAPRKPNDQGINHEWEGWGNFGCN